MSVVAIVGRPNVGKSTLFNRIIGSRRALVADIPGVTRDRHYGQAEWDGVSFTLIDTGGLSFEESDAVEAKVHKQSMAAMAEASVIICLFDGRDGITALDRHIVDIFRKGGKKVIYAANKIDTEKSDTLTLEFSELGISVIPFSAEHSRNVDELLDKVIETMSRGEVREEKKREGIKIALVGRPNVGKSTILNRLANEERVVAHELPGTTRDTIDVEVEFKGKKYIIVDTAGIKKKSKTKEKLDKFSTLKSLKAVEDADVVFVVLDAEEGLTRQDITLVAHSFNLYKATAVLLNKWDKLQTERNMSKVERDFVGLTRENLKDLHDLPVLCISGKTGYSCDRIFGMADRLTLAMQQRVSTAKLNKFFERLVKAHPVPDSHGKQVKLNYITQVDVRPPVFAVFSNQPDGVAKTYKKYLTKGLRELLGEPTIPIVVKFRSKS